MTLKISAILVFVADAFGVFIQLGRVVGSGEDVSRKMECGIPMGRKFLHGITQGSRLHVLVAFELDLADFYFRAFL